MDCVGGGSPWPASEVVLWKEAVLFCYVLEVFCRRRLLASLSMASWAPGLLLSLRLGTRVLPPPVAGVEMVWWTVHIDELFAFSSQLSQWLLLAFWIRAE